MLNDDNYQRIVSEKARLYEAQLLTRTLGNLNGCRRLCFSFANSSLRSRCFSSVPETSSPFQSAAIVGAEKVDTAVSYKLQQVRKSAVVSCHRNELSEKSWEKECNKQFG
jgi:hypothetical protein